MMADKKESTSRVKARPQGTAKDPLAEGNHLRNPSNSSDAKTYEKAPDNDTSDNEAIAKESLKKQDASDTNKK